MRGTAIPAAHGSPAVRTVYAPAEPVELLATVRVLRRGAGDPTFRREIDCPVVWRTVRTPAGGATLRLAQHADGSVHAYAWGDGAEWAIDGVPELLGAGDDWSGLDVAAVPLLAETHRRHPGLRLTRCRQVVEMLVAAILEQKVATVDAHRAWAWLIRRHGEAAPGPAPDGMRVPPPVQTWRRIPSWDWHRAGVDPKRSAAVMAATAVGPGLERTLALGRGGAEVAKRLRSVPGVGIWTSAETTQRSHGDPDAPSFGDLHLPGIVGTALIGEKVDDAGMLELLEPWRGDRQRVMRLIVASGVAVPRRAQRLAPQDHRFH
ncbi:DNA-3-methyladenine glycosylase family protein [uncultured Amnibacterium sp.]|uniref:DNA-3-methyladenine glycosylase family protein n=1 Tax=uncultured Amnibacterium sp. TaxID=1631851 RepID=UPI0035C95041